MKTIKRAVAIASLVDLTGYMGNTSQTSANNMGQVSSARFRLSLRQEIAMVCTELQTEVKALYARSKAIKKAERKRERKANLTGGLMEAGLPVLGTGAIANAGSAQSISNVSTATAVTGTAVSGVRGPSSPDAQTYNEALAIAERSALL